MKELYKKYRPKKFKNIIGQPGAIKVLQTFIKKNKVPHSLLFSGPSGCGKTTIARILRKELKCGKHDFVEINGSDKNGVDDMRRIRTQLNKSPISGKCKIWLIDEAHKISTAAQDMMLKMLEDTPKHIYFFLATTDPQKLKRTIKTRCTEIAVKSLTRKYLIALIAYIIAKEKSKIPAEVIDKIIEVSEGSARKALVLLNQIYLLGDEDDMLASIEETTVEKISEFIGKLLINPKTSWFEIAKVLKDNKEQEPESIRWGVLGYAKTCLLSGSKISARAYIIIDAFRDHFYDSKHAGLAAAAYEVYSSGDA